MSENEDALEFIVRQYVEPKDTNYYPSNKLDQQIRFLADNWENVQNALVNLYTKRKISLSSICDTLKRIRVHTEISIDRYVIGSLYPSLLSIKKPEDISHISAVLGIKPTDEQAAKVWEYFFEGNWSKHQLNSIIESIGVKAITQEHVDSAARIWLLRFAGELKLNEGEYLREPDDIKRLFEATKINPVWDKEIANRAYNHWLEFHLHEKLFRFLHEDVGVKPDPKKVQKYYKKLLEANKSHIESISADYILEELETAIKVTGIIPNERYIRKLYKKYDDEFWEIEKAEKITGIKAEINTDMNAKYAALLRKGEISRINQLRNKTKKQPKFTEADVQKAYRIQLEEGDVRSAVSIYLLTDIEPKVSDELAISACNAAIANYENPRQIASGLDDGAQQIRWAYTSFGEIVLPVIYEKVEKLIREEKFRSAEEMLDYIRAKPKPEAQFVFSCIKADWKKAKEVFAEHNDSITAKYPEYAAVLGYVK